MSCDDCVAYFVSLALSELLSGEVPSKEMTLAAHSAASHRLQKSLWRSQCRAPKAHRKEDVHRHQVHPAVHHHWRYEMVSNLGDVGGWPHEGQQSAAARLRAWLDFPFTQLTEPSRKERPTNESLQQRVATSS